MGMAARIGDMTMHAGSMMVGMPTVMIGKMPASRLGDMHVCPLVTPGTPPIPHVGGTAALGSTGVMVGGAPAARQNDLVICTGPPDTIALGCPTVLIGEIKAGGGGGGGAGGGVGGSGSASVGAITSALLADLSPGGQEIEGHFLQVNFQDKAKLPVTGYSYSLQGPDDSKHTGFLSGEIKRSGIPEGNYEVCLFAIVNAQWSKESAEVGETVTMQVDTFGIPDGTKAMLSVYIKDANYTDKKLVDYESVVKGDKIEHDYTLKIDKKFLGICAEKAKNMRYSQPFFYYKVAIGSLTEQSGLLYYFDTCEFKIENHEGEDIGDKKCKVSLPNGEIREGIADSQGKVKMKKMSPGKLKIRYG